MNESHFVLILIAAFFTILTLFNIAYLFSFRKRSYEDKNNNLDNYYKLDSKIELQKYLVLGFITIASIFGISKYSDVSSDMKKFEDLSNSYNELKTAHGTLSINFSRLETEYGKLESNIANFDNDIRDARNKFFEIKTLATDLESILMNQNKTIQEATEEIPDKIAILFAKELVDDKMRKAGMQVLVSDRYTPSKETVERVVSESKELLRQAGCSDDEINSVIEDKKRKHNLN